MARKLVSPDLKLYIVANEAALDSLAKDLNLGWQLKGNLRQLCGWAAVGSDRNRRDEAANWQRLETGVWLRHNEDYTLLPCFGKAKHVYETHARLQADMKLETLRKLLGPKGTSSSKWTKFFVPPAVRAQLRHGESIANRIIADDGPTRMIQVQVRALHQHLHGGALVGG